jgi:hypothetical protein
MFLTTLAADSFDSIPATGLRKATNKREYLINLH